MSTALPSPQQWGHRTKGISADKLITAVASATKDALTSWSALPSDRESCNDAAGYSRVSIEIPLSSVLADQLMNGCTGYRAHYAVSVAMGESFNRALVEAIAPLVVEAAHLYKDRYSQDFCRGSLLGVYSKFWYPKQLTDRSEEPLLVTWPEVIRHARWMSHWNAKPKPRKGLLALIAENAGVLLNGTFVADDGRVYEQKPGRSQGLFDTGWT